MSNGNLATLKSGTSSIEDAVDVHLRHLRWFVTLADELHFGRAAARLHITQSALSKAITRLENDVGAHLLQRTSRAVELTPAGLAFYGAALRTIADADEAVTAAKNAAAGEALRIRLGYGTPILDILTGFLNAVTQAAPLVHVELCNFLYADLSAGLRSGQTDAAFTVPHLDISDLRYIPLFEDQRVALLPADHPFASRPLLEVDDLRTLDVTATWLLPPADPPGSRGFRQFWSGADALDGRVPPRSETFASNEDMAQRIAVGQGVGLGFRCLVSRYALPGIVAVPVRGLAPASYGLAWRNSRNSPALHLVVEVARELAVPRSIRSRDGVPGPG